MNKKQMQTVRIYNSPIEWDLFDARMFDCIALI